MGDNIAVVEQPGSERTDMLTRRGRQASWFLLAVLAFEVLLLGWKVAQLRGAPGYFGSANAPHSDALVPWLQGTLGFYFHGVAPPNLYRPTIGLMFSSILSVTGSIGAIPGFTMALLVVNLAALARCLGVETKLALAGLGVVLVWHFEMLIKQLNPWMLMPDLPAFAFTLCGLLMTGAGLSGERVRISLLYPGLAWLGLAAAVRGPQMFGGALLLVGLSCWLWRKGSKLLLLGAAASFALPLFIDNALQTVYRIENNGVISMHCFSTAPDHQWSQECQRDFLENRPPPREIVKRYVSFVCSREGGEVLSKIAKKKVKVEAAIIGSWPFLLLLGGLAGARAWIAGVPSLAGIAPDGNQRLRGAAFLIHALLVPLALMNAKALHLKDSAHFLLLGYIVVAAAIALWRQQRLTYCALAVYLGGTVLVLLLGTPGGRRVTSTFDFALIIGYLSYLLEPPSRQGTVLPGKLIGGFNALAFVAVYSLSWLLPTSLKRTYHTRVEGRPVALKLSDDSALDRSLYYTAGRDLFYTHLTAEPLGTVRDLDTVAGRAASPNASFSQPSTVLKP